MSITRSDVKKAFKLIAANEIAPNGPSVKWDIVDPDTGQTWPPMVVLRVAYEIAGQAPPNVGGG